MTATITKKMIQAYEVRNDGDFGNVSIEEISYQVEGRERHACRVMTTSSFGDYGYFWSHCGVRGKKSLVGMSMDYCMGKFMGRELQVFDLDATLKAMRKPLLEDLRKREITSRMAREYWDCIDNIESERPDSESMFVTMCYEHFSGIRNDDRYSEPWHYTTTRYNSEAIGFWNKIWMPLMDELRVELEVERKAEEAASAALRALNDKGPF